MYSPVLLVIVGCCCYCCCCCCCCWLLVVAVAVADVVVLARRTTPIMPSRPSMIRPPAPSDPTTTCGVVVSVCHECSCSSSRCKPLDSRPSVQRFLHHRLAPRMNQRSFSPPKRKTRDLLEMSLFFFFWETHRPKRTLQASPCVAQCREFVPSPPEVHSPSSGLPREAF